MKRRAQWPSTLWELEEGNSIETARTMAVNAVVVAEMFYLVNSRFILAPVASWKGLAGNPYVLLAIAACIPLQIAYTPAPVMQAIFESTDLFRRWNGASCWVPGYWYSASPSWKNSSSGVLV